MERIKVKLLICGSIAVAIPFYTGQVSTEQLLRFIVAGIFVFIQVAIPFYTGQVSTNELYARVFELDPSELVAIPFYTGQVSTN